MRKLIIYLTSIPSPFQLEFIEECNKQLVGTGKIIPIFTRPLTPERKHWGETDIGVTLQGGKVKKIRNFWSFLNETQPFYCVFTQYNSFLTLLGVFWCIINKKEYFIGPSEPMNTYKGKLFKHFLRLKLFGLISKRAKGIAVMGNHAFHMYRQVYKGPIKFVFYSFDFSKLIAHKPNFSQNPFTFLYSGRLSPFRNPLLVIDCFSEVVHRNPNRCLRLIISGKGELYNDCINLIEKKCISDIVEWRNDFKDWYDIHNIYLHAHVLLALQDYSTWGIIIQEAMAAGLGIISTRSIEAANYLVIDGYNGFLVDQEKEVIINCMESYFDSQQLELHSTRSKELISLHNIQNQSKNFLELFD